MSQSQSLQAFVCVAIVAVLSSLCFFAFQFTTSGDPHLALVLNYTSRRLNSAPAVMRDCSQPASKPNCQEPCQQPPPAKAGDTLGEMIQQAVADSSKLTPNIRDLLPKVQMRSMDLMEFIGVPDDVLNWYRKKYKLDSNGYAVRVRHQLNWTDDGSEADYEIGIVPRAMDSPDNQYELGFKLLEDYPNLPLCMNIAKSKDDLGGMNMAGLNCDLALKALRDNFNRVFELWKPHCQKVGDSREAEAENFQCACLQKKGKTDRDSCLGDSIPPAHPLTTRKGIKAAECARPPDQRFASVPADMKRPIIAILIGTVSRGDEFKLPLLQKKIAKLFLTNVGQTIEPGFEYNVYLVVGAGDLWFDNDAQQAALKQWFAVSISAPAKANGMIIRLKIFRFFNVMMRFGPPFNFIKECAFADGADFFFRINDDIELLSPWAKVFVDQLARLKPPFVGMVGPVDTKKVGWSDNHKEHSEKKHKNMVIDFTHRIHHLIHGIHYPVVFSDWYTDGWINRVYLPDSARTVTSARMEHHSDETRYKIDHVHSIWMVHEIDKGQRRVAAYKTLLEQGEAWRVDAFVSQCPPEQRTAHIRSILGNLTKPTFNF